jgi:hypothetical protein
VSVSVAESARNEVTLRPPLVVADDVSHRYAIPRWSMIVGTDLWRPRTSLLGAACWRGSDGGRYGASVQSADRMAVPSVVVADELSHSSWPGRSES